MLDDSSDSNPRPEELSATHVVALFPFAIGAVPITARQADLCRGMACWLERRMSPVPGMDVRLQSILISPQGAPQLRGWFMTSALWSVEQALSLPLPDGVSFTHLIQGQMNWNDDRVEVTMEVIDRAGGYSLGREVARGAPGPDVLIEILGLLRSTATKITGSRACGRQVSQRGTSNAEAFEALLMGLAARQAWQHGLVSAENMLGSLLTAMEADPKYREAVRTFEDVARECLRADEASAAFAMKALERASELCPAESIFRALRGLALAAGEAKVQPQATQILMDYVSLAPQGEMQAEALAMLGHLSAEAGDWMAARNFLQGSLARRPENAAGWEELAGIHRRLGSVADAESCWRRALQEDPERLESLRALAEVYERRGDSLRSHILLEKAVELAQDDESLRGRLTRALMGLSRLEDADECATAWAEQWQRSCEAWITLAAIRRRRVQPEAVAFCVRRAEDSAVSIEDREAIAMERLATAEPSDFAILDRHETCPESLLREVAARHAELATPWRRLAQRRAKATDFAGALSAQNRVLLLRPDAFDEHRKAAEWALRVRDNSAAEAALRRCEELRPEDGWAATELSRLMEKNGAAGEALKATMRALILQPNVPEHTQRTVRLQAALAAEAARSAAVPAPVPKLPVQSADDSIWNRVMKFLRTLR